MINPKHAAASLIVLSACGGRVDRALPPDGRDSIADSGSSDVALSGRDAGATAECDVGSNYVHVHGDPLDAVVSGDVVIDSVNAYWAGALVDAEQGVQIEAHEGSRRFVFHISAFFMNQTLDVGRYENAQGATSQAEGRPLLLVEVDGRSCAPIVGSFEIQSIDYQGPDTLYALTASFEQRCVSTNSHLKGCVRFHR